MFGTKILIDAGEVAAALNWSRPWFRRKLKSLIADHGFPSPLPNGRWHAEAVSDWMRAYGDRATAALQETRQPSANTLAQTLHLLRKYGEAA